MIDFTYVEPVEREAAIYRYGGISEFELIYAQLVNDAIIERAAPAIVEKNSTMFYRVKGFKQAIQDSKEQSMVDYFSKLETARSIYGAGILDLEDDVKTVDQTLANLHEVDQIALKRLAMVTGIPLMMFGGEQPKGLNATGARGACSISGHD